jgi:hypothetical protein
MNDATEYNDGNIAYTYEMRIPSSDSYYRMSKIDIENEKLKKKMKSKKSKDEKKKTSFPVEDDDEYEHSRQVVTIKGNEMPDGANDSDEDDKKKRKEKNDPHGALADINLDE